MSSSRISWKDKVVKKEYHNWLAVGQSLLFMCDGVRSYVERETKSFQRNLLATLASQPPCSCPAKEKHRKTCAWAHQLKRYHRRGTPLWKQSDSTKWLDTTDGYWEIAKLHMSDLGAHGATVVDPNSFDTTALCNLMYWCAFFQISHDRVNAVRQTRNTKWGHAPDQELSDVEKVDSIKTVKDLLNDPELLEDPDAINSLAGIEQLENDLDLQSVERGVLFEALRAHDSLTEELKQVKDRVARVEKGSKVTSKSNNSVKQAKTLRARLTKKNTRKKEIIRRLGRTEGNNVMQSSLTVNIGKMMTFPFAMLRGKFLARLLIILSCIVLLDHNTHADGCPKEESSVPADLQGLVNFTTYLDEARKNFVGRTWIFSQVEEAFLTSKNTPSAVVVIGEPGAGKSALSAQLICSRASSALIHDSIIGYHLCKYSDKDTLDGGKFVRNLVDMISRRLPVYGGLIAKSPWILKGLVYDRCTRNPRLCFEESIVIPLQKMEYQVDRPLFVVIDALDECLLQSDDPSRVTSNSIVQVIREKMSRLPKWFKWIITSRNDSSTFKYFQNTCLMSLRSSDPRNLQDIEIYLNAKLHERESFLKSIAHMLGLRTSNDQVSQMISKLLSHGQGNFLFVREMLYLLQQGHLSSETPFLPSSLGEIYESYFQRAYGNGEGAKFRKVRNIVEVMIASLKPMSMNEMYEALRLQEPSLDQEYVFMRNLNTLEHFIRYDDNNAMFLFHKSFAEWLTSRNNVGQSPFYVNESRGHNVLADYHFMIISERGNEERYPLNETFRLAQHIALGDKSSSRSKQFIDIPSEMLNTSVDETGMSLLHLASSINNTDVLGLVQPHFATIDVQDSRGYTPAFLAAMNGFIENTAYLVSHGANVSYKTPPPPRPPFEGFQDPVLASKSEYWSSSLLHVASQGGLLELVKYLILNNASFLETNAIGLTSLHIAAEHGYLEIVRFLKEAGSPIDNLALYLAAKSGHAPVVSYLLESGVVDECIPCNGSFYWLRGEERYQGLSMLSVRRNHTIYPVWEEWMSHMRRTFQNVSSYTFINDKHLIFCETALHAAVSNGHREATDVLLSQEINALQCTDYTGRSPLHESIRTNNLQIMERLLLANANVKFKCRFYQELPPSTDFDIVHQFKYLSPTEESLYKTDTCPCGSTPFHLAARYGNIQAATVLRKYGATVFTHDCDGATPLHTAACHGHHTFANWLLKSTPSINVHTQSANGSTALHSSAICGKYEEVERLLLIGANFSLVDRNGMTPLHYAVLRRSTGKDDGHLDYPVPPSSIFDREYFSTSTFGMWIVGREVMYKYKLPGETIEGNSAFDNQCQSVKKLVESMGEGLLNLPDSNGMTALHMASQNGLECAVGVLIANGADSFAKNLQSETPVDLAIGNANMLTNRRKALIEALRDHVAVVHILLSRYTQANMDCHLGNGSYLHRAIVKDRPYIVLLLLRLGADVHCKDGEGRTPLLKYLQTGGKWIDLILKPYTQIRSISCGLPFNRSELHLLAYRKPTLAYDNFFYTRICSMQKCHSVPGPLIKAISAHPLGFQLISSCRDAEGYTPLHRAAQGGNAIAIREFLSKGAQLDVLTRDNQNALDLVIKYARPGPEAENRADISLLLYEKMKRANTFQMKCDGTKAQLTLYHFAAYWGLEKFLKTFLEDQVAQGLDVDCSDKYGFTPLYLAKLRAESSPGNVSPNPWDKVIRLIESHGGKVRFPERKAEIYLLHTHLYGNCKQQIESELLQTLNLWKGGTSYHYCEMIFRVFERTGSHPFSNVLKRTDEFLDNILKNPGPLKILNFLKDFSHLFDLHKRYNRILEGLLRIIEGKEGKTDVNFRGGNVISDAKILQRKVYRIQEIIKTQKQTLVEFIQRHIDYDNFHRLYVTSLGALITKYRRKLPSVDFENITNSISRFEVEGTCYEVLQYSKFLKLLLNAHFLGCASEPLSLVKSSLQTPFLKSRALPILLGPKDLASIHDAAYIAYIVSNKISKFVYLKEITQADIRRSVTLNPESENTFEKLLSNLRSIENRLQINRKLFSPLVAAVNSPDDAKWANKKSLHILRRVLVETFSRTMRKHPGAEDLQ